MVKQGPMTPPPSNTDVIQQHFQQLAHFNTNTSYPRESAFHYDGRAQLATPHSLYNTPATGYQDDYSYGEQQPAYTYQQHEVGLGLSNNAYNHQQGQVTTYYPAPNAPQMYQGQFEYAPSPVPSLSGKAMTTRSGHRVRSVRSSVERGARVTKTVKAPKAKKEKVKAEKKIPKLTQPLSVLTKAWAHVAVVDIEAYVNRSAEVRRREVEEGKFPGKVKRPMNSFMLYRKAYQSRTKEWCLQNNHQIVSQVCGDSWPLEPEETREQFKQWASIERTNHENAHPGYKFSPSKPGNKNKKDNKRKVSEEPEDSEESDLEDYDYRTGRPSKRPKRFGKPVRYDPDDEYHPDGESYGQPSRDSSMARESVHPFNHHPSSYQASNPGRPMPMPYASQLAHGQYYQQVVHPGPTDRTEDIKMTLHHAPAPQYTLPSNDYPIMQQQYQQQQHGLPQHGTHVDPSLFDYSFQQDDSGYSDPTTTAIDHAHGFMNPNDLLISRQQQRYEVLDAQDQKMGILKGHEEDWNVSALDPALEFELYDDNRN